MMEEGVKSFNPLRATVTRVCQLLGIFSPDCHKYMPVLMAFSYRLKNRRDTTFSAVRLEPRSHDQITRSYSRRNGFVASLNWTRCTIPTTRSLANLRRAVWPVGDYLSV
ncbi:hypothetical protein AVEN_182687-1 [Araneus ventricosus]|uniref:Uncharacterized protein n=1 Tax=Araneus ventricosus TaxID=182803 RepID=A0A4Y2SQX3_ARAVE|nr:hypothetical protein AVEN_182687-1 [Araneus ventricosus]